MRVFISINFPQSIKKEIFEIQKHLPEFEGKKTEFENLHLTLKFLGEIDEEMLKEIKERLKTIKAREFEASINGIGIFSPEFVRIIWLHLTNCEGLQKEIDNCLNDLFAPEKRFMSHLTIARVKKIKDKKEFLNDILKIKINKSRFLVNKFYLMKSELKEKGPVYSVLGEFFLK
jgi:2'-5' RNA ligase